MNTCRTLRSVPRLLVPSVIALAAALLLSACELSVEPGPNPPPADRTGSITGRVTTINAAIPAVPLQPGPPMTPTAASTLQPLAARQDFVPDQLLVTFEPRLGFLTLQDQETQMVQLLSGLQPQLLTAGNENIPALFELAPGTDVLAAAAELQSQPGVAAVQPNYIYRLLALPNDPDLQKQWPLPLAGLPLGWEARTDSAEVIVAVLDTGFDLGHPDLQGVFTQDHYSFCSSPTCASSGDSNVGPDSDNDPHGTHVAGILAAVGNNNRGISGVISSGKNFILPVKVFYQGVTTSSAVIRALNWAAGLPVTGAPVNLSPANIINISLGAETNDAAFRSAISTVSARGVLLVAASGNDGDAHVLFPAAYPEVLAVGSANSAGQRSCFSNYGPELDLLAPGGEKVSIGSTAYPNCPDAAERLELNVFSTTPGGNYEYDVGTSMAAPVVSGIAALVWADMGHGATAGQVRQRLLGTAYRPAGMPSDEYGSGLVRADAALGFAGPGNRVVISNPNTTATGQATLNLTGSSSSYQLTLPAGMQQVNALARGTHHDLTGSMQVEVEENKSLSVRPLRITP